MVRLLQIYITMLVVCLMILLKINARIAELNARVADLCADLDVPYLNVFGPLAADPTWDESQRDCDGVHATGDGYQLIADQIAGWPAWRTWFAD